MRRVIKLIKDYKPFQFISFALPVGITFFDNVGSIAKIRGTSMQPEFNPQPGTEDIVYLNKWSVTFYQISKGDIVTLISPEDPSRTIIRRVMGLENDVIHTKGYKSEFVRVPEGHCWVEGSNTRNELDSNAFGPVSLGLIQGKADFIIWPPSRWRSLNSEKYREFLK